MNFARPSQTCLNSLKNIAWPDLISYDTVKLDEMMYYVKFKCFQTKFEIKVLKPHADMKKKFPKHPEMIIKKMKKELDKEVNK